MVPHLAATSPTSQSQLLAPLEPERLAQSTPLGLEQSLELALLLLPLVLVILSGRLSQLQTALVLQPLQLLLLPKVRNRDAYGEEYPRGFNQAPFFVPFNGSLFQQ